MLSNLFHRKPSRNSGQLIETDTKAAHDQRPSPVTTANATERPSGSTRVLGEVSLEPTYSWGTGLPPGPSTPDLQQLNAGLPWQERAANISREVDAFGIEPGDPVRVTSVYGSGTGIFSRVVPETGSIDYVGGKGPRGDDVVTVQKIDAATLEELEQPTHGRMGEVRTFEISDVASIAFDRTGTRIAAGGEVGRENVVRVFEVASGKQLLHLPHGGDVVMIAFAAAGNRLASSEKKMQEDDDGVSRYHHVVRVFDASDGAELVHLSDEQLGGFSPDGSSLVTRTPTEVIVRDAASGDERLRIEVPSDAVVFSADGARIVVVDGIPPRLQAFDSRTGGSAPWARAVPEEGWPEPFSPDGTRLLTFDTDDRTASVWDTGTGVELLRIVHDAAVWDAAFAPDGTRLATASGFITEATHAHVWDAVTGAEQVRIELFGEKAVAFSPDGNWLATDGDFAGFGVRGLHLWDVSG